MHPEADAYHHLAIKTMDAARRVIREHFVGLPWRSEGGELVVDAGCGSGETTKGVLLPACGPRAAKIYGFDLLPDMIRKARQVNGDPAIEYTLGDFGDRSSLPEEWENRFDKAFSNYAMHWVPDPRSAASTIYRLLKPGGYFVVSFLVSAVHWDAANELRKWPHWEPYCTEPRIPRIYFRDRSDDEIRRWFQDVGFRVLKLERQASSQVLDTKEHFDATIKSISQFYEDIPEELRPRWVHEFGEEVLRATGGRYDICGEIAVVVAQKPDVDADTKPM